MNNSSEIDAKDGAAPRCGCGEAHCINSEDKQIQYFGAIGTGTPATFPIVDRVRGASWLNGYGKPRLWRVVSMVQEVQRFTQGSLPPLQPGMILADGVYRSLLRLGISVSEMGFEAGTGGRGPFLIDAGESLELWGTGVRVNWIAPAGINENAPAPPELAATGLVLDGMLGVKIIGIETPLGHTAKLTDYRGILANARATIQVPAGASDVTIYQSSLGVASAAWLWNYGTFALPGFELGQIPFIAGQRRSHTISVAPSATHIVSDVDANNDRFFTVVWTIRP